MKIIQSKNIIVAAKHIASCCIEGCYIIIETVAGEKYKISYFTNMEKLISDFNDITDYMADANVNSALRLSGE